MNELERYIREHAAEFDVAEPAEGHEDRFLRRCAPRNDSSWKIWGWGFAVAMAVLAAVVVLRPAGGRGFFFGVGNDPQKVYLAYLDKVESARVALADSDEYNWEGILRGMTEEAVPMIEQLPEELSGRQQARILKQYYGDILAGVEQLKKAK